MPKKSAVYIRECDSRREFWEKNEALFRSTVPHTYSEDNDGDDAEASEQREGGLSLYTITKEIILEFDGEKPLLTHVMYLYDPKRDELVLTPALARVGATENEILEALASAVLYQVPVYPNTEEELQPLLDYHNKLLDRGFTMPDPDTGLDKRYWLADKLMFDPNSQEIANVKWGFRMVSPAEMSMFSQAVRTRIQELESAQLVLTTLDNAIDELSGLLEEDTRNEGRLQSCLTKYPILFGPDYREVIPKHELGSEFEMDYALVRVSGLTDLLEIEPSSLSLFTRGGNPRSELVHAEQQVLDWLEWLDENPNYAQKSLPGVVRPAGFVIIGTSRNLSIEDKRRLRRRNLTFQGTIQILTFDDILDRAKNLRKVLTEYNKV